VRVLVALSSLDLGGSMLSAIELAASVQDQLGWEMVVYAPPGPAGKVVAERGLRFVEAPAGGSTWSWRHYRHMRTVVACERPDLVHAWDWQLLFRSYYALHLQGVPVIGSCTAMSVPALLPWGLPISFVTAEIRAQDRYRRGANYLQEYPINMREDDPVAVNGAAFRAGIGVDPGQTLLVVVSRLARWMKREGIARTIEAVGRLAADRDIVLAVVGDGDARHELEAMGTAVNRSVGRQVVRFTGAMVDPRPAYAAADISLGMGTSIVRAMAFGVPGVVLGEEGFSAVYDLGTAGMLGDQGFYGLGDPVGADARLDAQLAQLIDQPGLRTELGQLSRDLVKARFSVDTVALDLAQRYRHVAAAAPDRSRPVVLRAIRDAAIVAAAAPARRVVPDSVKFKLQRRHTTRNQPQPGVSKP
jgi:glycosyltransferase involved in cell wall biosynthesis